MKTTTCILLLMANINFAFSQGKVNRAKSDLKSTSSKESYVLSSGDNTSQNSGESFVGGFALELIYFISYGTLIGDLEPRNFNPYPFADGGLGEYNYIETNLVDKKRPLIISNTSTFQSSSFGNDLRVNYRFIPVLGLEVNHLHLFDRLEENSDLGISSAMLNFYRIRESSVTGYWGLGATYVGSDVNTTGFAYNLGLDIFIANPISLGLFWKQSFINEENINEFRALLRYHIKKLAFHGGFIHYKIGSENFPSAAIGLEYRF